MVIDFLLGSAFIKNHLIWLGNEYYVDILDMILANGLENGRWSIFGDFKNQVIYGKETAERMLENLESFSDEHTKVRLDINCRNPYEVGKKVVEITGITPEGYLSDRVKGSYARIIQVNDYVESAERLKACVNDLLAQGVLPSDIAVLSRNRFTNSVANDTGIRFSLIYNTFWEEKDVIFTTVYSFKGLERKHVIIVDFTTKEIEDAQKVDNEARNLLCTGITRTTVGLTVICMEKISNEPTLENIDKVLSIIHSIPVGRVLTYGKVARLANVTIRVVMSAFKNAGEDLCCYRVVGDGGALSPQFYYRGLKGVGEQTKLLQQEGILVSKESLSMLATGGLIQ